MTEECTTCVGVGRIRDADSGELRCCLDCNGSGSVEVKVSDEARAYALDAIGNDGWDDEGYYEVPTSTALRELALAFDAGRRCKEAGRG